MQMEPLFSIIIPHYNIPELLMRCLKSIPVTEEIQVIVVDDNSPDAATYLERYPELSRPYLEFVRTTKGGGAGYARNIGIEHAKGKWLLFSDADDLFVEGLYELIMSYVNSDSDIIFFKIRSVMSDNLNISLTRFEYINQHIDKCLFAGDERYVRFNYPVPWGKMYKRNFVDSHSFRFDEVKYSNDNYFSICTGYYARKIVATNSILYIYTTRSDSLTSSFGQKPGELEIRADVSFRIYKFLKELHINQKQETPLEWYLIELLKKNRVLFQYYWRRVSEVYPSRYSAIMSLCKGKGRKFMVKLALYSAWIWLRPLSYFKKV